MFPRGPAPARPSRAQALEPGPGPRSWNPEAGGCGPDPGREPRPWASTPRSAANCAFSAVRTASCQRPPTRPACSPGSHPLPWGPPLKPRPLQPGGRLPALTCGCPPASRRPPHTRREWAASGTASQLSAGPSCPLLGHREPGSPAPLLGTWPPGRSVSCDRSELTSSLLISPCDLVSRPQPSPHLLAPRPGLLLHGLSTQEPGDEAPGASRRWQVGFPRGPWVESDSGQLRSCPCLQPRLTSAFWCLTPRF